MTEIQLDSLQTFKERFEEIKSSKIDDYLKSIRFAALMTDMEHAYSIPLVGTERITAFRRAYPEVMDLYRKVSLARPL